MIIATMQKTDASEEASVKNTVKRTISVCRISLSLLTTARNFPKHSRKLR